MKGVYMVLLILVVAASALGCISNKQAETSTQTSSTAGNPVSSPDGNYEPSVAKPISSPVVTQTPPGIDDQFGTDADLASIESLVNDSDRDISLSDI